MIDFYKTLLESADYKNGFFSVDLDKLVKSGLLKKYIPTKEEIQPMVDSLTKEIDKRILNEIHKQKPNLKLLCEK